MKKSIFKKWWFWVIIVIIVIGASIGGGNDKTTKDTSKPTTADSKTQEVKKEEPKKAETKVTYDNFLKVKMGMKHADVVKILGEGTQESSSEVSGTKTAMYSWSGEGMGNMNTTIQNGVVVGKAQSGLKNIDSNVTLEKFNNVKKGMTYEKIKSILGEGEITSKTKIIDAESTMYSWINKDGSNMNCTFMGGKLEAKAQFNLK